MAPRRALLALTALLLVAAPACAATPAATAPPAAGPPSSSGPIPLYTLDGPGGLKPTDVEWHAESRTFFVSTFNQSGLYRGGLDDPRTPVFLQPQPGQTADSMRVAGGRIYVCAGIEGEIRVYDIATRQRSGTFQVGPGGHIIDAEVTGTGDVYATDAMLPTLWHLTPDQVAAGSGTAQGIPVTPEIRIHGETNLFGIIALTDHRLVVGHRADGQLYRIDLDDAGGRTIVPITGATVPLNGGMALDGDRLLVADQTGVAVLALGDDDSTATLVEQIPTPSIREPASVTAADGRYLVVGFAKQTPDTVASVPAAQ
jgi:hypothetical protein